MNNQSLEADGTKVAARGAWPATKGAEWWRATLARFGRSGLRPVAFCRDQGIAESTFYNWRRRLGDPALAAASAARAGRGSSPKVSSPSPTGFAAVTVADDLEPVASPQPASDSTSSIELHLPGRRRVIIRDGFDPQLLIRLVRTLEHLDASAGHAGGAS